MPKIGSHQPYLDILCNRCGSKRVVAKRWTEVIEITNGTTSLTHVQMVCTNKECQSKFESIAEQERVKREKMNDAKQSRMTAKSKTKAS